MRRRCFVGSFRHRCRSVHHSKCQSVSPSRLAGPSFGRTGVRFTGPSGFRSSRGSPSPVFLRSVPAAPSSTPACAAMHHGECFFFRRTSPSLRTGSPVLGSPGAADLSVHLSVGLPPAFPRGMQSVGRSSAGFPTLASPRPDSPFRVSGPLLFGIPLQALRLPRPCFPLPDGCTFRDAYPSVSSFGAQRTLRKLKLVALRFSHVQPSKLALLALRGLPQEFPQTVDCLREPPSVLCAVFPDAFVWLPLNTRVLNCLSWGFPKTPLHRLENCRSPLPVPGCPVSFGKSLCRCSLVFRPSGFSPVRRLSPPTACRDVSPCFRSWGSPRFRRLRNRHPRVCDRTLRSLPSVRSDDSLRCRSEPWGECQGQQTLAGHDLHHPPFPSRSWVFAAGMFPSTTTT